MKICIIGLGNVGSVLALQLSLVGKHEITAVARGMRLADLRREGCIVHTDGRRGPVLVADTLDVSVPFDLVIVCTLAPQALDLLPVLSQSQARNILFMFNTFDSIDAYREAVGAARFAFGFPGVSATMDPETRHLDATIFSRGQPTICTDARWASLLTESGVTCHVEHSMQDWLKTHFVLIAYFQWVILTASAQNAGLSWAQCQQAAEGMHQGFALVKQQGHRITPTFVALLSHSLWVSTLLLYVAGRSKSLRAFASRYGPTECRQMLAKLGSSLRV